MKRKFVLPALIASIFATTVGAVASSLAWFSDKTSINPDSHFSGASNGAYFGGGDGSSTEPFLIKNPRHLYNLAWLQYMGYFNRDEKDTSGNPVIEDGVVVGDGIIDKQYYFQLDNDIDMSGWKIPPIGTSLYPFVGNFDGNNKTISNLTTTNRYQDYNKVPTTVKTAGSVSDVEIVGFFGVIGTLANSGNSITSGTHTYTYSTSAVSVNTFGLDNFSAKSVTNSTLIGLVAGYVNGPVSQVAVKGSKIITNGNSALTYTSKLSDYSLAGFVRDAYKDNILKKDVSAVTPSVENETQSGSGDEFGASIDMKTMYDRLYGLKTSAPRYTYVTSETYYDGAKDDSKTESTTYTSGGNNFVGTTETDDSGNTVSQYTFYDRGTSYDSYLYLYGQANTNYTYTRTDIQPLTSNPTNGTEFYISSGTHNLRYNSGITDTTDRYSATLWTYTNNGRIYNGSRYLRNNGGTFTTTTNANQATTWTFARQNSGDFVITSTANNNTYVLTYNNGWTLINTSSLPARYKIHNGSNYLRWGGTSDTVIYNETNSDNATIWETNNNGYYYPVNNTNYYIGYGSSRLQAATNNSVNFTVETNNNNSYLYGRTGGWFSGYTYYYAKYGSPTWTCSSGGQTTARNNATALSFESIPVSLSDYPLTLRGRSTSSTSKTFSTNPTYFPLSYEENVDAQGNGLGTYNNNVAEKNTGYVISGTNYASQPSDMRVSKYANKDGTYQGGGTMKQLYASLNDSHLYSGTLNNHNCNLHVVTRTAETGDFVILKDAYNSSYNNYSSDLTSKISTTKTVTEAGLVKYTASRNQMHTLFNSTLTSDSEDNQGYTYVYGLHFMDAAISPSNKISVPYAYINGTAYSNYQLPRDSIDFNLKNNGYINFFAGSYFPGNTTFFSLHNIFRDGNNNITDIKEISKIYKNTGSNWKTVKYIYEYTDGTLNDNVGTYDSTSPMFDMEWVTDPTMVDYALYYFEIPVNKGEYALGSVSGKDGAYLIYLDIGAGVKTKNITTYTEQITTVTDTYAFIKGMEFVAVIPTTAENFAKITGEGVANIGIPASANGNTTFSYNASDKILTCGPPGSSTLTASYIQDGVTVSVTGVENPLVATATSSSTTVLDKVTTITYDNETGDVVKVISTKETVDGVEGDWDDSDPEVIEEGVQEYEIATLIDSAGAVIAHFHYQHVSGATVTIESEYDSETDTYAFTITSTVNITIYVDLVLESAEVGGVEVDYTVTINGDEISTGDTVSITAS